MKIGIVSSYFYPWYGGITEHVFYLYKELKKRGYDVKLITPFDGKDILEQRNDLIRIGKPLPFILNGSVVKVPFVTRPQRAMNRILKEHDFDILHLHQPLFCLLGLSVLHCVKQMRRRGLKTPGIIGTFHACGGGTERFFVRRLGFYFKRYQDEFFSRIAVSTASRDFVKPILPGEYQIIPNGVDLSRFSSEKQKIDRFDDGVKNILFVGRLEPRKGLTTLLQSIPLIQKYTTERIRLIVVGNGVLTRYYRSRIPPAAEDSVIFTGEASFDDLPRFYKTADIFCSPATYGESFGIVLIEAMAAGVPIVAGNNEGYRKVIKDGVNGLLVDPTNPDQIARAIARLLHSPKLACQISSRGIEDVKKYSWSSVVDQIEQSYRNYINFREAV
jgi:phosphatidylinositol alpha-mannosyltransferase